MHSSTSPLGASATAFHVRNRRRSWRYPAELLALEVFCDRIVSTSTSSARPQHFHRGRPKAAASSPRTCRSFFAFLLSTFYLLHREIRYKTTVSRTDNRMLVPMGR